MHQEKLLNKLIYQNMYKYQCDLCKNYKDLLKVKRG